MSFNHTLWMVWSHRELLFVHTLLELNDSPSFLCVFSLSCPRGFLDSFNSQNVTVSARELPSIRVNVISNSSYPLLGFSTLRSIRKQAIFSNWVQNSSIEDTIFYQLCLYSSQERESCLKDWRRLSHFCCCQANRSFYASIKVPKLLQIDYTSRLICRESIAARLCLSQYT